MINKIVEAVENRTNIQNQRAVFFIFLFYSLKIVEYLLINYNKIKFNQILSKIYSFNSLNYLSKTRPSISTYQANQTVQDDTNCFKINLIVSSIFYFFILCYFK
eukprot:357802_1